MESSSVLADSEGMHRVLAAETVAPLVRRIEIEAQAIAKARRAGQFVIVRIVEGSERIPLTIADADVDRGSIVLFVQAIGRTTQLMNALEKGDAIRDVAGPLGTPSRIARYGRVVVIGGGVGAAIAYPTAVALARAGNDVIAVVGARSKDHVLLEAEFRDAGIVVRPCTDDGSYGTHGFVTDVLRELLEDGEGVDAVFAAGPVAMMAAVAELTRPTGVRTEASLNPIMVDGTGMCGGCRVQVGGETKFACVDGPEFDAHLVDFDLLARRNQAYRTFEVTRSASLRPEDAVRLLAPVRRGSCEELT